MHSTAILGGGVSGLVAAYELQKRGVPVTLLEKDPVLGGLAAPFSFRDLLFDKYYHFLCLEDTPYGELLAELGLQSQVHWKTTAMGYWHSGTIYRFASPLQLLQFTPLSFLGRVQYGLGALKVRFRKSFQEIDSLDAPQYLIQTFGEEAYHKLWEPILQAKFDRYAHEVSGAWIWARIHRVATSRSRGLLKERYGYLKGGTQTFLKALLSRLCDGVQIFTGTPVSSLTQRGKMWEVETPHKTFTFSQVLSTLPLPVLQKVAKEHSALFEKHTPEYMGVLAAIFFLKRPLTPFFWVNIVDSRVPFSVLVEYTNLDPREDFGGSLLYIPYYLPPDHPFFQKNREALLEETFQGLTRLFPSLKKEELISAALFGDRFAQPVCRKHFARKVLPFNPLPNLYCIESTQLYPRDRTIAGQIQLVRNLLKRLQGPLFSPCSK